MSTGIPAATLALVCASLCVSSLLTGCNPSENKVAPRVVMRVTGDLSSNDIADIERVVRLDRVTRLHRPPTPIEAIEPATNLLALYESLGDPTNTVPTNAVYVWLFPSNTNRDPPGRWGYRVDKSTNGWKIAAEMPE